MARLRVKAKRNPTTRLGPTSQLAEPVGVKPVRINLKPSAAALDILNAAPYAPTMEAWYLPVALALLAIACVLMGLFGAESRPDFVDGRVDKKERWFVHSKID